MRRRENYSSFQHFHSFSEGLGPSSPQTIKTGESFQRTGSLWANNDNFPCKQNVNRITDLKRWSNRWVIQYRHIYYTNWVLEAHHWNMDTPFQGNFVNSLLSRVCFHLLPKNPNGFSTVLSDQALGLPVLPRYSFLDPTYFFLCLLSEPQPILWVLCCRGAVCRCQGTDYEGTGS